MKTPLLILIALLGLSACGGHSDNASNNNAVNAGANNVDMTAIPEDSDAVALDKGGANAAASDTSVTDGWIGRWNGPEGLFLDIGQGDRPGTYSLTIKDNLDSQAHYAGIAGQATIRFTRRGKTETMKAGTGKQTGYKWLADKTECLIIVAGKEGYCR